MALTFRHSFVAVLVGVLASGCSVDKTDRPELGGPSELGTSLALRATPDTLPQDGVSTSQILIEARDSNGQLLPSLGVRAEIAVNGTLEDFGRLSAKNVVTGSDGRATVVYRAPLPVESIDRATMVTIQFTPAGTDARNQIARTVDIRLVPPGVVTPPRMDVPDFEISPDSPVQGETVGFDASDPDLDAIISHYAWNFGDGSKGSGRYVSHTYDAPGSYAVTLTVTDFQGRSGSRGRIVEVESADLPSADFVVSPTDPGVNTTVFLDASTSAPAPGRQIVSYQWQLGNGTTASGKVVSTKYATVGTFTITLTVTDDLGNSASASKTVTVQ